MTESVDTKDAINLRLSDEAKNRLSWLVDEGYFLDMKDAYRLGVAYSLAHGLIDAADNSRPHNYLNVGSLDPNGILKDTVVETFGEAEGPPYKVIERLADVGVRAIAEVVERTGGIAAVVAPDSEK